MDPTSNPELLENVVRRLAVLADANRLRLLARLRGGPYGVSALAAELGIRQASVSKHLAAMHTVGLVDVTRQANRATYRIADASIFDLCAVLCDGVVRHLQRQQERLTRATAKSLPRRRRLRMQ